MSDGKGFLKDAYRVENQKQTKEFYESWAKTYDQEIAENGYATPGRCAAALSQFLPDPAAPILDFGCGTGLSGLALRQSGFTCIDGCDLSPAMLKAAEKRGLYRALHEISADDDLPFASGSYRAISAMGVLASSHAPAMMIDTLLDLLPADGLLVFSLNDHTLEDASYESRIAENVDTGTARLLFKEYGDHLPGIGLNSFVYILQRI